MANGFPKLHQAVVDGDASAVSRLLAAGADTSERCAQGWTALQVAQWLDQRACIEALGGVAEPAPVKVVGKNENIYSTLTSEQIQEEFNIRLLRTPRFSSFEELCTVQEQLPWVVGYFLPRLFFREHRQIKERYLADLQKGALADVAVRWIDDDFEYGLFSHDHLEPGTFVGEYTGLVRRLFREKPDQNPYCLHYPTKYWNWWVYCIDSMMEGNATRFINHSANPNLDLEYVVDDGILRFFLIANTRIPRGFQLTFDYGTDFWRGR